MARIEPQGRFIVRGNAYLKRCVYDKEQSVSKHDYERERGSTSQRLEWLVYAKSKRWNMHLCVDNDVEPESENSAKREHPKNCIAVVALRSKRRKRMRVGTGAIAIHASWICRHLALDGASIMQDSYTWTESNGCKFGRRILALTRSWRV